MNLSAKATVTQLRRLRPNRTWAMLLVALTIGLLAALAARSYLTRRMEAIEATAKGKTVTVIVAKRDIAKGGVLSADNMALRPIPVDYAHSGALNPDDFERIDGQRLGYAVKSGEMIMWSMMETQRARTFSAHVAAGRRAMTVPVDEINSISGMLEPGDAIDLLATVDRSGKKTTFPVLQNVEVMATGQRSQDDPKSGTQRNYSTVTIDTSPEQARLLIAARDMGKLTALLRNPQDKQPIASAADVAALLGLGAPPPIAGGHGRVRRTVPVLYGNSLKSAPAEALRLGMRSADAAPSTPAPSPAAPPAAAQAGAAP